MSDTPDGGMSVRESNMPKFEGTWVTEQGVKYVFIGNTWQLLREAVGRGNTSGTFTLHSKSASIQFTVTDGGSGAWTSSYEFKNNDTALRISDSGSSSAAYSQGDFVKQ
jgi:hypothetical protein